MTHADEARRIAPPASYGTLCNEIAAALAAAERAGWIAGRDAAADAEEKHHGCEPCGCDATPGAIARALLPAAVTEPAAKRCSCATMPSGSVVKCAVCVWEPAAKCATCRGTGSLPCDTVMCKDKPWHQCPDCVPAEPAAKCATCGGAKTLRIHEAGCSLATGTYRELNFDQMGDCRVCYPVRVPCPSCSAPCSRGDKGCGETPCVCGSTGGAK